MVFDPENFLSVWILLMSSVKTWLQILFLDIFYFFCKFLSQNRSTFLMNLGPWPLSLKGMVVKFFPGDLLASAEFFRSEL
jgi:hypothetical protein